MEYTKTTYEREFAVTKGRQQRKFQKIEGLYGKETKGEEHGIDKNRWVINVSNQTIDENEMKLLSRGLNFAVTPSKLPVDEFITATEIACHHLKDDTKSAALRSDVTRILQKRRNCKQNISVEERKALQKLSQRKDLKILPADKGRVTVVMEKNDYESKIKELLNDQDTYCKLRNDPTNKFKAKLVKLLKQWKDKNKITQRLWQQLYPTASEIPKFYGLPKVHKKNTPLRPIVSSIGSITYEAAKYLARILGPLVGKTPYHIKNSKDFANKIKDLEVPPPWKLVSFDVSALFTSIPIDEAIEVVKNKLQQDLSWRQQTSLQAVDILQLLELCLNTTYSMFKEEYYQQEELPWHHPSHPL